MQVNAHRTVAMVLFNDVLLLDVTGPMDAFAIANRFCRQSGNTGCSPWPKGKQRCAAPVG